MCLASVCLSRLDSLWNAWVNNWFYEVDVNCTVIQILCIYGYSASIYIFCILLCSFNICLLHWIFLGYGCASKIYFVFKNIHEGFEIPVAKKLVVTAIIVFEGLLQAFLFKVRFIYCADQVIPATSKLSHMFAPTMEQ